MEEAARIYYWVRVGALSLIVLVALVTLLVQTRRRRYSTLRRALLAAVPVVGVFALWAASGVMPSWLWIAGLMVVGAGLGWAAGRMSRVYFEDGTVFVKRSAFAPIVGALAAVLAAFTLLFGTSYLFAIALLVLAFSAGLSAGSAIAEMLSARGAAPSAAPLVEPPTVPAG
jgi:hypothetical protein